MISSNDVHIGAMSIRRYSACIEFSCCHASKGYIVDYILDRGTKGGDEGAGGKKVKEERETGEREGGCNPPLKISL